MGHHQYFERYASLLGEGELLKLFDIVKSEAKSISEAARRCGIERKTIYDIMNEGKQVRESTKERILRASLKANFEKSIELLLTKSTEDFEEILSNYLSLIYQHAMQAQDKANFNRLFVSFESVLDRYSGIVAGDLQQEVTPLANALVNRSAKLGIPHDLPRLKVMDSTTLAIIIPGLIQDFVAGTDNVLATAKKWRIEPSLAASVSDSVHNMFKMTGIETSREFQVRTNPESLEFLHEVNASLWTSNVSRRTKPILDSAQNEIVRPDFQLGLE